MPTADGARLRLRLTPGGRANRLDGILRDSAGEARLAVSVTAVAEKGRANAALIALLARQLGIAKSRIALASGATARRKWLAISGDAAEISGRLAAALAAGKGKGG